MYRSSNYSFSFKSEDMPLVNAFKIKTNPLTVYKIITENNRGIKYVYTYKQGLNICSEDFSDQNLKSKAKNIYFYKGFGVFTTLEDAVKATSFIIDRYSTSIHKVIKCFINSENILAARMFYKNETENTGVRPSYLRKNRDLLYSHNTLYAVELWVNQLTINSLTDLS